MIQVKLPDGSTAQFPDGTPNDVMTKAIQAKFPPQPQTAPSAPQPVPDNPDASLGARAQQGLSGLDEGIAGVVGFPVDATQAAMRAGAAGIHALGGPDIQLPVNQIGGSKSITDLMGKWIAPPSTDPIGRFARTAGQDIGAAALPVGGAVASSSRPLATAAMNIGATLLGSAGGTTADAMAPGNPIAHGVGEMLGAVAPGRMAAMGRRLVTPFDTSPERAAMADTLQQNGVDLTAGQRTGNNSLRYAESELGGGTAQAMTDRQQEQFTRAALSRAGISADRATPEVMQKAFNDIGGQFDQLAANNNIIPDKQLGADLRSTLADYQNVAGADEKPIIGNSINDIVAAAQTGQITGAQYKSIRSRLGRAMQDSNNPELKGAIRNLQSALDGGMERSVAQTNPQALGDWQQARRDYANLMTLTEAAAGPGENTAVGLISPSKLRSVVANRNARSYVQGQGDFADLARSGEAVMKPLPNSASAARIAARTFFATPAAIGGALLGQHAGGDMGAIMGGAAAAAIPHLAGKAMLSPLGRKYLSNQLLSGGGMPSGMLGPLSAMLINQTSGQ